MSVRLSLVSGWFLNQAVYLWVHHPWVFKRVPNLSMAQDDLVFLPNTLCSLLKISWGTDWNLLSLRHEKNTELLSDCRCIFISVQAMSMLGYTSVRGLACALRRSVSVPALLLLVNLPYWTLIRKREQHMKEASVEHSALRSAQQGFWSWVHLLHQGTFEFVKGDANFILNRCCTWWALTVHTFFDKWSENGSMCVNNTNRSWLLL